MKIAEMNVEYIDHYGSDLLVANAARVSFSKRKTEFESGDRPGTDERLIKYLARENHFMPFCHPHITLHVKAPIFVARQLAKHQIGGSWSEVSRRYVSNEPEIYLPNAWRTKPQGSIKQGSGGEADDQEGIMAEYASTMQVALGVYDRLIDEGIAPEQARMVLPQSVLTEWYWTGSLMFFCRVCKLRLDEHSQKETREIAERIAEVVAPLFPVSWSALMEN